MLIALSVVITLAFGSIGLFAGMRAQVGRGGPGHCSRCIFVFLFLSSMSLPRDLIETDWFQTVATYNPVSYMIEGIRSLLITGWDAEALALGFGCAIVILVAGIAGHLVRASRRGCGRECAATSRSPQGLASRLLRKLFANPALFLPPMLMPIFFFVAFAGGLSADLRGARVRLPGRLHRLRVRLRADPDRQPSAGSSPASRSPRTSRWASGGA